MHEKGYNFTVNLAYDIDWSDKNNKAIIERELMKLVEYYLAHPDVKRCSLFDIPIYKVSYSDANGFRQCGAGVEMISYDADGKGYPCQFFMPISVGEERSNQASGLTFNELITEDNFEEPCKSCKALRICRTCYGANYATNGNIFKKDSNWCILQKVIFKANAYLAAKQIENNTLSCQAGELPYLLKSVQTLLTDFD
jgi:radical SAM protein with 4Fe4S-binding SPASM domain